MTKYSKGIIYVILFAFVIFLLHVFTVLYEEVKVRNTVKSIFEKNNYGDISLIVCHEEKCLYDFGAEKGHIEIYTVGRNDIEARIELARKVASTWPNNIHLCKKYFQNTCRL